jgi:uncharacterized protein Smg (DUF494 family)
MYERIIEIIVLVISELKQNKAISDIDVDGLQTLGYTNSEISTAISWLVDRVEFSDQFFAFSITSNLDSFRILHDAEKELFTQEAWGQIIQFNSLGILTNEHIETLIERTAMMGMRQIDIHQLKYFLANLLFNIHTSGTPGSRIMLHGNESIN